MENLNYIKISGIITSSPEYSHEVYGNKFYKFSLSSMRTSGVYDTITCLVPENLVEQIVCGEEKEISGHVKTHNEVVDGKTKLHVYVFVRQIYSAASCDENDVELLGYICKISSVRKTPVTSKKICDVIVAVNRPYSKRSDYIPTVVWGRNARHISSCEVGTPVYIRGRLQSREYLKVLDDGMEEVRTAYELSAGYFEVVENAQM